MTLKQGNFLVCLLQIVQEKWGIYCDFSGHTTSYIVMFQFKLKTSVSSL